MFNKKFFVVMAVLLSASLFLIGCPTEAEDGLPGANGEKGDDGKPTPPSLSGQYVTADDLDEYFIDLDRDEVVLQSIVEAVFGTVPEGKKLIVVGTTSVFPGQPLTVAGTLEVRENAVLVASYVANGSGYLARTGGAITGKGSLVLPVFVSDEGKPANVVAFGDSTGATGGQAVGSYNTNVTGRPTPASALDSADIAALIAAGQTELTVSNLSSFDPTVIPAGKTLTLTLTGENDLAAGLDISSNAGVKLTVASGAYLSTGGSGGLVKGAITIEEGGTLTLQAAGDSVDASVTNNGTISVTAALANTAATTLLGVNGSGAVVFGDEDGSSIPITLNNTATVPLKQKVVIGNGASLTAGAVAVPFSSPAAAAQSAALALTTTPSQPITIDVGGVLALPAAATGIGVAVENNGTISTLATDSARVIGLLALPNVTGTGRIKLADSAGLSAAADLSVQDVVIGSTATLTVSTTPSFTGTKKIINEGTLDLGKVSKIGVKVVNRGTIRTTAVGDDLNTVLPDIDLSAVPETTPTALPNLLTVEGKITTPALLIDSKGAVTFTNAAAPVFGAGSSIKAKTISFDEGFSSPATDGTVTLDGAVTIASSKDIAFGGAAGTITLAKDTTISNNEGSVVEVFSGAGVLKGASAATKLTVSATSIETTGGVVTFDGTAEIDAGLTVTTGGVVFNGPVDFGGSLTLANGPATFNGNVTFADNTAIEMTVAASIVTLGPGVYLGLPNTVGVPAVPAVYRSVIYNPGTALTETVVLTPTAGTALSFTTGRTITQGNSSGATGITIKGKATLPAGATYKVDLGSNAASTLTLDGATTELALAKGYLVSADEDKTNGVTTASPSSKLTLTGDASNGASLAGAGKVLLGNASITGGASGAWQAGAASTTIVLEVGGITGTGTSPVLKGITNDSAVITLGTGAHVNGDAETLTVTNATIDIATNGAVAFPWVATNPARLVLKGGTDTKGALKLGSGTDSTTNRFLTISSHSVEISNTTASITFTTSGAAAGTISGGATVGTNDATITGQTSANDVIVKAGATLAATGS